MSTQACQIRKRRGRAARRLFVNKAMTLLLLLTLTCSALNTKVRCQAANEYQVKAAFLYNFVKFVEWPAEAFGNGNSLIIGIVGNDPFGSALDQAISGKNINGRQMMIRRFKAGQDLKACHILFISSSERNRLAQILHSLKGASVLTVGEMGQFNQQGGIINFIVEASKVRFEINAGMAEQSRLKISSKLLALAKAVRN